MKKTEKEIWLSPAQAAKRIGVSRVTLYRYINKKDNPLPAYKLSSSTIKISCEELDQWIIYKSMQETIKEEGPQHYE